MLLNEGADVNAKNSDDETALYIAIEEEHTEIVKLIRNHIKHKNLRDARLVTEKGKKEGKGTPLVPQARRDVSTMIAEFMGGKRKTKKSRRKSKRKTRRK
jgi:ankyrin repeat protein